MKKAEIEFTHYNDFDSVNLPGTSDGRSTRIISSDSNTGDAVRVSEFEPGTDTTKEGVQSHDYWEEVYIIEGSVIDLTLNKEFTAGMVASRPPGMQHGPWISPNGCKMFEVIYHK